MMRTTIQSMPAKGGAQLSGDALVLTSEQNTCRVCALMGHTCCQGHEIYVTWGDCRRIARHFPQMDFFEYRACEISDYQDQDDDPFWQRYVFRKDGTRRVLKRQPNSDCLFLAADGCRLELAARPLICRLYPHLYTARGISGMWDTECVAARLKPSAALEAGIEGVARRQAEQWHHMLYEEILWEENADEHWTDL